MPLPTNVNLTNVRRTFSADQMAQRWTPREFSKQYAAETQLDTSVRLFFHGELLSSITLGGAVEASLPNLPEWHFWSILQETGHKHPGVEGNSVEARTRTVADMFNASRNWLKHDGEKTFEMPAEEAVIMIIRAATKFVACYGAGSLPESVGVFETWLRETRPDLFSDVSDRV